MTYTKATLDITLFDVEDIITTSNQGNNNPLPLPPIPGPGDGNDESAN